MNKIIYLSIIILFSSCAITGHLKNSEVRNAQYEVVNNDKIIFIATKTSIGNGLTIGDVLAMEKKNYGNDISILNIIEQNKQLKLFGLITIGFENIYVYDVVRYKK